MKDHIQDLIEKAIKKLKETEQLTSELSSNVQIERTKDVKHGDFSSNIALMLAKPAKMKPQALAAMIIGEIPDSEHIAKVEIAGPGFINFFIHDSAQQNVIAAVLEMGENFGKTDIGHGKKIHIEYVSANPTGPLHVGHGRGAAYGAVVSDLLEAVGYNVHREYYVNDAGRQMNILAVSVWLRYLEIFGAKFSFPSNGYKGIYIRSISEEMKGKYGDRFVHAVEAIYQDVPEDAKTKEEAEKGEIHIDALIQRAKILLGDDYELVHYYGTQTILDGIKDDLANFGVYFQEWFSEKSLTDSGAIQKGIDALKKGHYVYEEKGALWFKSTQFGDEKDRVLVRANGISTYFASDVAYHWNKLDRGYDIIIDIFGADHHGYVPRVRAAMRALGLDADALHVPLVQFAVLYREGKKVQMSTRSGEFVTLRELCDEVGRDAARFFYVMRKAEQHMDFDLDLAKSKSNENPVYYVQYAHARICSVFRQLDGKGYKFDRSLGLSSTEILTLKYEKALMTLLSYYPELIVKAANNLEPHLIANYLKDLANAFHVYYNAEQFIVDDETIRNARLCLIFAVKQIISNGLRLLGVSAPESM